jgi:hypothetical protein
MTELIPAGDCLLVFLDETGHETFAGDQHYFGFGGCAMMVPDYEILKSEWRALRQLIAGSPDAALHAANLRPTPQQFAGLKAFFSGGRFFRLAVTATKDMTYPDHLHSAQPVMELLKKYVASIASHTPCKSVALVFESSQRGDPLLQTYFGALELADGDTMIPVEHCVCPKSTGEVGLEIADFIINAAGSETRRRMRGTPGFSKDFQDVFHSVPSPLIRFCLIDAVVGNEHAEMAHLRELR